MFLEAVTTELEVAWLFLLQISSGCLLRLGCKVNQPGLASVILIDRDHGLAFVARGHRDRLSLP